MRSEYLRVAVYRRAGDKVDFIVKRDNELPSITTHDSMEGHFNVTHGDWEAYLQKLKEDGWAFMSVEKRNEGREESYHFKRRKE